MAVTWRALTESDVLTGLTGPESTQYRTKLLSSGQDDPLPEVIEQVTTDIRDAIRSGGKTALPDDETLIPLGAVRRAVALARYQVLSRMIGNVTEARTKLWEKAERWLERVEEGKVKPPPYSDESAPAASDTPCIEVPERNFDRDDQDGI